MMIVLPPRWLAPLAAVVLLWLLPRPVGAAVYSCQQAIPPASLGGKTIWLTIESAQAPFEASGTYRLDLNPDGTYTVPAVAGVAARSGTWSAARPAEYLILRLNQFHGDAVVDVLALFDDCPSCLNCGYSFHREDLPTGSQTGTFVVTDGEAPPPPPTDIGVRGITGGGTYQAGASVFLSTLINYVGNPSTYKFAWSKAGVPVASAIPGYLSLPGATPADSGTYTATISRNGITNQVSADITVQPAGTAPGYQDRVWQRIADWVPGSPFGRTWFRVNAGVVTIGGDRSVWRWADGQLVQLVNSTTPDIDGIGFSWVDAVTIESEGAFNFLVRNKLYECRAGTITQVPTPGLSVWAVARSDHRVAFLANSGSPGNGLYLWNGTELATLVAPSLDLPGRLTRIESARSLAFDGERVLCLAFEGQNGALFAATPGAIPTLTLYAETGGTGPAGASYRGFYGASLRGDLVFLVAELSPLGTSVVSVERTGKATRLGGGFSSDLVSALIPANLGRQFHHLNATALEHWTGSTFERYLGPGEKLDDRTIKRFTFLDAHDQDVVAAVEFTDGTAALYGLFPGSVPPLPVVIQPPLLVGDQMAITVATTLGMSYTLETQPVVGQAVWNIVETVSGTGNPHTFNIQPDGASGFFRVGQHP